jgi:hypothetical protein
VKVVAAIFLLLLLTIAVASGIVRRIAEDRIADEVQESLENASRPEVSVGGFLFLFQALRGSIEEISIEIDIVRERSVALENVRLVDRGSRYVHDHFVRGGSRFRNLVELEHFRWP